MATAQTLKEVTPILAGIMSEQRCIHAVMGRAPETKMCANNYECGTCPYDQLLEDMACTEPARPHRVWEFERAA
ncbi:MAG: hypothetical protein LDL33_10160 [Desulfomonile sp.]|nr:hypothetical protein [Desulfomonile sp.]